MRFIIIIKHRIRAFCVTLSLELRPQRGNGRPDLPFRGLSVGGTCARADGGFDLCVHEVFELRPDARLPGARALDLELQHAESEFHKVLLTL